MFSQVASALLINPKKEILLQLRDNKPGIAYPGYWGALGGHCNIGETPLQCLKRELKEEIGFIAGRTKLVGIFDDGLGNKVSLYKIKINKKIKDIKLNEGKKLGYFTFPEIIKLHSPKLFKEYLLANKKKILCD